MCPFKGQNRLQPDTSMAPLPMRYASMGPLPMRYASMGLTSMGYISIELLIF